MMKLNTDPENTTVTRWSKLGSEPRLPAEALQPILDRFEELVASQQITLTKRDQQILRRLRKSVDRNAWPLRTPAHHIARRVVHFLFLTFILPMDDQARSDPGARRKLRRLARRHASQLSAAIRKIVEAEAADGCMLGYRLWPEYQPTNNLEHGLHWHVQVSIFQFRRGDMGLVQEIESMNVEQLISRFLDTPRLQLDEAAVQRMTTAWAEVLRELGLAQTDGTPILSSDGTKRTLVHVSRCWGPAQDQQDRHNVERYRRRILKGLMPHHFSLKGKRYVRVNFNGEHRHRWARTYGIREFVRRFLLRPYKLPVHAATCGSLTRGQPFSRILDRCVEALDRLAQES